ncbi:hypothetical protein Calab_0660 [Caldithrix abyssi DSM 13497]|uniref:Uncharacterized protein n=1 Tax=Caldithrix abyssi DSM 13497 TaxID=880073 RepID=H1XSS4_CALAY|nr:hypothetical protein Calab_0660 [Caldithrix abyssi DSM 13497]
MQFTQHFQFIIQLSKSLVPANGGFSQRDPYGTRPLPLILHNENSVQNACQINQKTPARIDRGLVRRMRDSPQDAAQNPQVLSDGGFSQRDPYGTRPLPVIGHKEKPSKNFAPYPLSGKTKTPARIDRGCKAEDEGLSTGCCAEPPSPFGRRFFPKGSLRDKTAACNRAQGKAFKKTLLRTPVRQNKNPGKN